MSKQGCIVKSVHQLKQSRGRWGFALVSFKLFLIGFSLCCGSRCLLLCGFCSMLLTFFSSPPSLPPSLALAPAPEKDLLPGWFVSLNRRLLQNPQSRQFRLLMQQVGGQAEMLDFQVEMSCCSLAHCEKGATCSQGPDFGSHPPHRDPAPAGGHR